MTSRQAAYQPTVRAILSHDNIANRLGSPDTAKNQIILLIINDLLGMNWEVNVSKEMIKIAPPATYDKSVIRRVMSFGRDSIINKNRTWIDAHIDVARKNLADGTEALKSPISPIIEVCKTPEQMALFRIFRYYWSSPYSDYVGRRIKLIIRDSAVAGNPVIGIAALGSPIIHIPERDRYIGWEKHQRTNRINYMMDAYVIGALPPYNYLLGGKLISYLLASKEIRDIFHEKYQLSRYNKLAGIFTTSLYGKSSQYNRLSFNGRLLYRPIGDTKGFGTLHITDKTFNAMRQFLADQGIIISHRFGSGPSWRMRVIRTAATSLGFNSDELLRHSFKRKIYFIPLAKNSEDFLRGDARKLRYYRQSAKTLTCYWQKRWLHNRKKREEIITQVANFKRESFEI